MAPDPAAVAAAVEAYVAELDDTEFAALAARTREPKHTKQAFARDLFAQGRAEK